MWKTMTPEQKEDISEILCKSCLTQEVAEMKKVYMQLKLAYYNVMCLEEHLHSNIGMPGETAIKRKLHEANVEKETLEWFLAEITDALQNNPIVVQLLRRFVNAETVEIQDKSDLDMDITAR